jgi:hypothetical protein
LLACGESCRAGLETTYVRPVERRTPARKAETAGAGVSQEVTEVVECLVGRTQDRVEGVVRDFAQLCVVSVSSYATRIRRRWRHTTMLEVRVGDVRV